jgi:hypothetical protein
VEGNTATACGTIKIDFTIKHSRKVLVDMFANLFTKTGIVHVVNLNDKKAEYI